MDKNYLYYHILKKFNVSRETFPLLEEYFQSILEENKKINLISDKNDRNLRKRHIIDCAQIIDLINFFVPIDVSFKTKLFLTITAWTWS